MGSKKRLIIFSKKNKELWMKNESLSILIDAQVILSLLSSVAVKQNWFP